MQKTELMLSSEEEKLLGFRIETSVNEPFEVSPFTGKKDTRIQKVGLDKAFVNVFGLC